MVTPDPAVYTSLRDTLRSARHWRELLADEERRVMLGDIARVALAMGRELYLDHELDDLDIGEARRPEDTATPRERIAFLQEVWPRLDRALHQLESEPAPGLIAGSQRVLLDRARRVRPKDLLAAVRGGDLSAVPEAITRVVPLASRLGGRLPRHIAETVAVPTFDTPANRAIKTILVLLARDLNAQAAVAAANNAPDLAAEASRLRLRLRRHLCRTPWRALAPLGTVPPLSAALRTHGAHRLLHDTWRRYRRQFAFDWENPLFTLPARETWQLYEYWGFFQVARALRTLGLQAESAEDFRLAPTGRFTFVLVKGTGSQITFRSPEGKAIVSLCYNRTFARAATGNASGWHSRSHAMRPDITLEAADGRLLLLDTKFKTYTGLEDGKRWRFDESALRPDIQQMHSYRDAIAYGSERGRVRGAWLLFAGRKETPTAPVVSYPRRTRARFGHQEVGAIHLRPGNDPEALFALIAGFLQMPLASPEII